MQEAKLYLVQFAEDNPSEFFKHTPNEVVFTRLDSQKNELYITNFLGRGDMVNKNNVCITNDSIPKFENRWIGAHHVLQESGKHVLYYAPKNIAMSGLEKELFFKAQALPHSIGKYVDAFHITDEIGIHNLYGTYLTRNPLAIQKHIEKQYPRFTSSSLLVNDRDSQNRITDWTPIDNTSVHKPAYGMELAEVVDSCSCLSGNGGSSCISKLRYSTNQKKKMTVTVAQSSIDHGVECIEKGFENNKTYFESDNAHYQFLAQSSIMGESEGSSGTNATGSEANANANANTQNSNANNAEGSQGSKPTNENQTKNLGEVLLNKTDHPGSASEMSKFTFGESTKPGDQEGGENKPEGDGKPEGDQNSIEYWKAKALEHENQLKEIAPKVKGYDEMKIAFDADQRLKTITNKVNELGKGKMSEERRQSLINYYAKEFTKIADQKELAKLIETQFEMILTPQIKQSGETVDEISAKFLAKNIEQSGEEKRKNNRFIDVTKVGEYLS